MIGLEDLPTELLEHIFLQQDASEDMISLGTSSTRLHQMLTKPRMWWDLLAKAQWTTEIQKMNYGVPAKKVLVNYSLVDKLRNFLKTVDDRKLLLGLLHLNICARFSVQELCSINVSLPLLQIPKSVSFGGLACTEDQCPSIR